MLSFSTRERPAVLCILAEVPSITHLTFTPQPSRPANTHTRTHTHTKAHRLRTHLEYLAKERNHTSCLSATDVHIHMESFYIIALKDQKQPSGHFLGYMGMSRNFVLRNLSTWVINNLRRPMLIHRVGETAHTWVFLRICAVCCHSSRGSKCSDEQ